MRRCGGEVTCAAEASGSLLLPTSRVTGDSGRSSAVGALAHVHRRLGGEAAAGERETFH